MFGKRQIYHPGRLIIVFIALLLALPSSGPVLSDDPGQQVIESDDPRVLATGNWQRVDDAAASGGAYLRSAGDDAALSLWIDGGTLEVVYVAGPDFGTLSVEIDGTIARTIDTAAATLAYDRRARFDYLSDEVHQVRVLAAGGTVAVDALVGVPAGPTAPDGGGSAVGATAHYYYGDQRIPLQAATDYIVVKFNTSNPGARQQTLSALGPGRRDGGGASGLAHRADIMLVPLPDGQGTQQALNTVRTLQADPNVEWSMPVYDRAQGGNARGFVTGEIIIGFHAHIARAHVNSFLSDHNAHILKELPENTFLVRVPDARQTITLANSFRTDSRVAYAEPNFTGLFAPLYTPNDFYYGDQWHLHNTGQHSGSTVDADIDAPEAWDIERGSSSVIIAILDDGVDIDHPDLNDKIVVPWDPLFGDNDPSPNAWDWHGTACAGIAAAETNNASGVAGVCPDCRLMPIRIFYTPYEDGPLLGTNQKIGESIDYAWQNGAAVLSNSWGGGYPSSYIDSAISRAVTNGRGGKGSVVLFAAGNGNSTPIDYPANLSTVVTVGASNWCDQRKTATSSACNGGEALWGSDYGASLEIMAPGHAIYTTDVAGSAGYVSDGDDDDDDDYVGDFNGTSSSTPLAAGAFGLLFSLSENLNAENAKSFMFYSADDVNSATYPGHDIYMGHGRINMHQALVNLEALLFEASDLNAPLGANATNLRNPTFNWDKPGDASTWYMLQVYDGVTSTKLFEKWYPTADVCGVSTCEVRPADMNLPGDKTLKWYVRGYTQTFGNGPWSPAASFTIETPPRSSPTGTVTAHDGYPDFSWQTTGFGETYYQVWVSGSDGFVRDWWLAAAAVCTGDNCTFRADATRDYLKEGVSYQWWIRGWELSGYGPWSSATSFAISAAPPSQPTGLAVAPNLGTPTFTWNHDTDALWYRLWVGPEGGSPALDQWYQVGEDVNCVSTCSLESDLSLTNNPSGYKFWVQGWGAGGYSEWSSVDFAINYGAPQLPEMLSMSPAEGQAFDDSYSDAWLSFGWDEATPANASWYEIYISQASDGKLLHREWFRQRDVCSGGSCAVALNDINHQNVAYKWWVQGYGPAGYTAEWAGPVQYSFAQQKSVVSPVSPGDSSAQAPYPFVATNRPTFEVSLDAGSASWYRLWVSTASGTKVYDEWFESTNCDAPCTRSFQPAFEFVDGDYKWWVLGWGPTGSSDVWGGPYYFTVSGDIIDVLPGLSQPTTGHVVTDGSQTFRWVPIPNVYWHAVLLWDSEGTLASETWMQCWDAVCELTVDDLPAGNYMRWSVQGWRATSATRTDWPTERVIHILE